MTTYYRWHGERGRPSPGPWAVRPCLEQLEPRDLLMYTITDLGTLGGMNSHAHDINHRGQVVRSAQLTCSCATHPFLWVGGYCTTSASSVRSRRTMLLQ